MPCGARAIRLVRVYFNREIEELKVVNRLPNIVCLEPEVMALLLLQTQRKIKWQTIGFAMPLPDENLKSMTLKRDVRMRATIEFCEA